MSAGLVLAIDQGTTSSRAIAFDRDHQIVAAASRPISTTHPSPGWVEVDPIELLETVLASVAEVLDAVGGRGRVSAAGIANQGETVVAWDADTLAPLAPAIVWQCRRSAPIVERIRATGVEPLVRTRTGLPLDPYYSSTKLRWLLDKVPAVRSTAAAGRLRLGTVDAWLTARLGDGGPGGRTDPSTASRTQLLDLAAVDWAEDMLMLFGIERAWLPLLGPTHGELGSIRDPSWGGSIPLRALICDQAAALHGHLAGRPPSRELVVKATYGTGVFVVSHADEPVLGQGLETSIGWTTGHGRASYILQGGVLAAGALVDWLRDDLGLVVDLDRTAEMAMSVLDTGGVLVLPALTGLGAPWYRPDARGVVAGLTAGIRPAHIVRAAFDAICHRVVDILDAIGDLMPGPPARLLVDGGATVNPYLMQRQADLSGLVVEVSDITEVTALGTALMAAAGPAGPKRGRPGGDARPVARYEPALGVDARAGERAAWRRFLQVASTL